MFAKLTFIILLVSVISGCSTCKQMYPASGSKLNVEGLDFPINPTTPVKIGKFVWEPVQIQKVNNALLSLDAYSYSQCRLLETVSKSSPNSPAVGEIANKIAVANEKILTITTLLASEAPPAAVANTAEQQKPPKDTDPPKPPNQTSIETMESRLDALSLKLKTLTDNLPSVALPASNQFSYSVGEFDPGKIVLTPKMIDGISSFISSLPPRKSPKEAIWIDCVGFSDSSGEYLENIQLALARARSVGAYLEATSGDRPRRLRSVSSGGIAKDDAMKRRVDIYVTQLGL